MEELKNELKLELTDNDPRRVYYERKWDSKKTIIHWGQRKLLMTEIMFLTKWGDLSNQVVYVGAAPGRHIQYLSQLFKNHQFILIDPNPFEIKENHQIKIINGYFDDEKAKEYIGRNILFISDMRTADYRQMTPLENEQYIIKDNQTQMRWISIMRPIKSMIKFRCPFPNVIKENIKMYQGLIFVQPWAPPTSTETRLVIDYELNIIEYDNLKYEQQLFYHNTVTRYSTYPQPVRGEGIDNRFDSCAEVKILGDFLTKYPQYLSNRSFFQTISEMSSEISRSITNTKRTLMTHLNNPQKRRQFPKIDHTF